MEAISPELRAYLVDGEGEYPAELLIASRHSSDLTLQLGREVDEVEAAWITHREHLMAECMRVLPGTRPAAWWWYDAPEECPDSETEAECLDRLGLLTSSERRQLKASGEL